MNEIILKEYWDKYKSKFDTLEFDQHEKYKWAVLAQCYEKWDWTAEEKATMFKNTFNVSGPKNLWMSGQFYPTKMVDQFFEIDAEDVIFHFDALFDESKDLNSRIQSFIDFNAAYLPKLREVKQDDIIENHYHSDLRAISLYLTLQYPEKYFLYKHSMNKAFSEVFELPNIKKGQISNYEHYLSLCNEILDYIKEDSSFIAKYKEYCNKSGHYSDEHLHLLVQDFIYSIGSYLRPSTEISYWIFQCNPDMFDLVTALDENLLETWTVSAHKDKIKEGDKAIIWMTGDDAGCYALADVIGSPESTEKSKDDHLWKGTQKSGTKVNIEITHNFSDRPILKSHIEEIKTLSGFKGGNQGTNFQSSKLEYDTFLSLSQHPEGIRYWLYSPGENASKWETFYKEGIMGLGWDNIGDLNQYKSRLEIKNALINAYGGETSKSNDVTANDDFVNKMKIGDIIIVKKGKSELLGYGEVTSDYFFIENRIDFKSCRKIDWKLNGNWKVDFSLVTKTLTDITVYPSVHPDYNKYHERLMGIMMKNSKTKNTNLMIFPLNTIFYGPPGTGKTHLTIKRAAEIITGQTIVHYNDALKIFKQHLGTRIEFITFHQNYSYEDFIQGLRPDTENGNQLTFQKKDGVFMQMAINALYEYYKKSKTSSLKEGKGEIDINEVYLDFVEFLKNSKNKEFASVSGAKIHVSDFTKNDNIEFKHQNSSRSYLVSGTRLIKLYERFPNIGLIKNVHNDIREAIGGCNTTVYFVALREFIQFKESYIIADSIEHQEEYEEIGYESKKKLLSTIDQDEIRKISTEDVPPYVIIIDEINRANISRVFGELITLIEPDKRSHGDIPLQCTLPSGDTFIVPSNLYIIGTMNTADKSIALLDIALRRRFEFEAMYPIYELKDNIVHHKDVLEKINASIILRKGYDFQIGHAYFMDGQISLEDIMNKKVIPLLLEYFMNDKKEVEDILKSAGLTIQEGIWPIKIKTSL